MIIRTNKTDTEQFTEEISLLVTETGYYELCLVCSFSAVVSALQHYASSLLARLTGFPASRHWPVGT